MQTTGSAVLNIMLGSVRSKEGREVAEDAGFFQVDVFKRYFLCAQLRYCALSLTVRPAEARLDAKEKEKKKHKREGDAERRTREREERRGEERRTN